MAEKDEKHTSGGSRITGDTLIAGFALLLSGVNFCSDYVTPPKIVTTSPEQVLFRSVNSPSGELVRFAAQRAYVNRSRKGGSGVLTGEAVRVRVGEIDITHRGQYHGDFVREDLPEEERHSSPVPWAMVQQDKRGMHPLVIEPGSAVSHETDFAPRMPKINYLTIQSFTAAFTAAGRVDFCFIGELYEDDCATSSCFVEVSKGLLTSLEKRIPVAPSCTEAEPPSWCQCPGTTTVAAPAPSDSAE